MAGGAKSIRYNETLYNYQDYLASTEAMRGDDPAVTVTTTLNLKQLNTDIIREIHQLVSEYNDPSIAATPGLRLKGKLPPDLIDHIATIMRQNSLPFDITVTENLPPKSEVNEWRLHKPYDPQLSMFPEDDVECEHDRVWEDGTCAVCKAQVREPDESYVNSALMEAAQAAVA